MKASKVHKRLAKIEALIADLTERYSKGAVNVRAALQGAKVAVAHLKAAVSSQASPGTAKKSEAPSTETRKPAKRKITAAHRRAIREGVRRRLAQKKAATAKAGGARKKVAPATKKTAVKRAGAKAPTGNTAKKSAPLKKAAGKTLAPAVNVPAPVRTVPVPTAEDTRLGSEDEGQHPQSYAHDFRLRGALGIGGQESYQSCAGEGRFKASENLPRPDAGAVLSAATADRRALSYASVDRGLSRLATERDHATTMGRFRF